MKKVFGCIIVFVLSYWVLKPLFATGYFPMHDDTQVARVVEMGRALRGGQFPVRWVSELGYGLGYPIFNFYGPLPYYVGGFFYALGVSGLIATKLMMGIGLIGAGIAMYVAVSEIVGISGGVLAAVFYMYAPYHAVDAYVRGAVGEYWALIFLPIIFLGVWRIIHKKTASGLLLGASGIAGVVLSHTILGYASIAITGFACVFLTGWYARVKDWVRVKTFVFLILLGLGLSAFFWLPAITEMKYTNVASQISATADYHDHFVCLPELWNSIWGYGGSAKGCLDGFSMKIGKVHLITSLLVLFTMALGFIRGRRAKELAGAGTVILLMSVFFMLPVSTRVWEVLPLFSYLQYPWRFLTFATFGVSLTVGVLVYVVRNSYVRWVIVGAAIIVLLFVEAKRFVPQYTYDRPEADFETASDIRYRVSKISDEYLPAAVVRPTKVEDALRDTIAKSDTYELTVNELSDTYNKFTFLSGQDNTVVIRVAYFPGWHFMVNENVVVPTIENGLPVVTVPSGFTVVQMQFRDTTVRAIGNWISLISLVLYIFIYDRKNKKIIS